MRRRWVVGALLGFAGVLSSLGSGLAHGSPFAAGRLLWPSRGGIVTVRERARRESVRPVGPPAVDAASLTLDRLARVVMAEAGNQPESAQIGVADVVLHRLTAPGFPSTVWGVLHQPGQFTSVANGLYARVVPTAQAWQAARAALAGVDVVPGALYFDTPALDAGTPWTRQLVGCHMIGAMRFCQTARE